MKLAASDFDGTLYTIADQVSDENMEAIHQWRKAGNKFGIVTGRDKKVLMKHVNEGKVPYDYLICNNGAIIFDGDQKCLYHACMPDAVAAAFIVHPCLESSHHRIMSTPDNAYAVAVKRDSWLHKADFGVEEITLEQATHVAEVTQVTFSFPSTSVAENVAAEINRVFGDSLYAHQNENGIDVTPVGISKSTGIQQLQALMGWQDAVVCAIGDEKNDLSMIRKFHGFTVKTARDEIKQAASKVYDSVAHMLKEQL